MIDSKKQAEWRKKIDLMGCLCSDPACCEAVPALMDEVERLQAELKSLKDDRFRRQRLL